MWKHWILTLKRILWSTQNSSFERNHRENEGHNGKPTMDSKGVCECKNDGERPAKGLGGNDWGYVTLMFSWYAWSRIPVSI